jgi:predicted homoserine dehydrogenase-like protein
MILIDRALARREEARNPIRVGLVGAGYMGTGIARQIIRSVPGMRVAAIYNRSVETAHQAYEAAGASDIRHATSLADVEEAVGRGTPVILEDPELLYRAEGIDVLVEATGTIEFAARVTLGALEHGKHVVLMNAELDATLGPILKVHADRAGVVLTNSDGDQPGVIMNLIRFVKTIGCRPVLAGNMKGLQDPYRTPETQKEYAAKHNQQQRMVTSFADGTKISMEMAVVANATGFRTGRRGMYGPECQHVRDASDLFPLEAMLDHGLVDYVLGAEPGAGVFVLGYNADPIQQQYLRYYKMGEGPVYVFYTPYHLCHMETPLTVARAVEFGDAAVTPLGGPVCDVITVAKRSLESGEVLDGIGGFTTYGVLENSDVVEEEGLLPNGLSEGCRMRRPVSKDEPVRYDDVDIPAGRIADRLRTEQSEHFGRIKTETP